METKNRDPKIAVIGLKGLPAFGGAATVGENIIEQLKDKYDFTVYSSSSHTDRKSGTLKNICYQIVFKALPFKKFNSLYYYIVSALHAVILCKYDLVHLHHRASAFIIPILKCKYKVVLTTHQFGNIEDKWKKYSMFLKVQERFFSKLANVVTCVSKEEKEIMKKKCGIDACFIPNGVADIKIDDFTKKKYDIVFSAGRIIEIKGLHILFEALIDMKKNLSCLVIGDLDQIGKYKARILNLSKDLDVTFLGLIKDKDLLYSYLVAGKIFVFPSLTEAMSTMLLEVAALKIPIVCSNISANTALFDENEVIFFENNNSTDLQQKIEFTLEKDNTQLANNAYLKVRKNHDWCKISKQYKNVFDSALRDRM